MLLLFFATTFPVFALHLISSCITKTQTTKYLQVQSFLNLALVPLRSLSALEATVHQTGDSVYHVREQVGPDSGLDGLPSWHSTVHALMASIAEHTDLSNSTKQELNFAAVSPDLSFQQHRNVLKYH